MSGDLEGLTHAIDDGGVVSGLQSPESGRLAVLHDRLRARGFDRSPRRDFYVELATVLDDLYVVDLGTAIREVAVSRARRLGSFVNDDLDDLDALDVRRRARCISTAYASYLPATSPRLRPTQLMQCGTAPDKC